PHLLHVDLAGDHLRQLVGLARAHRPAERIGAVGARLLPAHALARALPVAIALLHRLGELLGALAQRLERLALRVYRAVGIAVAELAAGVTHGAVGLAEAILAVITLVAPLLLLVLVALLARSHAALGELLLQFLQAVAQALLILLQVAHVLVAVLLAAHAVAPRVLALLEGLVAQLLLLADHVVE